MIDYYEPKLDLTLLGCGFLGSYHLGAIYLLKQIWPQRPYNRICGASCGGLLGALLVAGLQLECVLDNAMDIIRRLRDFLKGPSQRTSIKDLIEQNMEKLLPADAHQRCSGRLGISVTKLWPRENKFVSNFHSRRDLIEAVCAGCFIPIWSGSLSGPKFRGETYIDGAYTNNAPKFELTLDERHPDTGVRQIEVSPFAGEVDVSPRDQHFWTKMRLFGTLYLLNWDNLFVRARHAMLPVSINKYRPYLIGGHGDMKDYVLRTNLVKCHHCYLRETKTALQTGGESYKSYDNNVNVNDNDNDNNRRSSCLFCLKLLERVDSLEIPAELIRLMHD